MKTKLFIPFLTLCLLLSSVSFANPTDKKSPDPEKDKVLISVLNYMLTRGHYVEKDLNDDFSASVFTSFIDGLEEGEWADYYENGYVKTYEIFENGKLFDVKMVQDSTA